MIWMPKGGYYFKSPIVFTKPNVILKGEGEATEIICTTPLADGQAQITLGTVGTPNGIDHCQFLDFYMHRQASPAGGGTGCGIRGCGQGTKFERLHIQWFDQDGIVVDTADGYDTTTTASTASTITVATGTGARFATGQTVTVKQSGNQETVSITGISGDVLTVSPNLAHSYPAGFLSRGTNYFETTLWDCVSESNGRDNYVFSPRMFNAEAFRCIAHGGKNLTPYAGRHGFYIRGTQIKLIACHPYFNPQYGCYVDGTAGGVEGKEITIQGGEYENNGGCGIWIYNAVSCEVLGALTYANGRRPDIAAQSADILLSYGSDHRVAGNSVDPQAATNQQINGAGSWTLGGNCICLTSCQKCVVEGNACQEGTGNGIRLDTGSKWNTIAHNEVHSLVSASAAIKLDTATENEVVGNIVDAPIAESTGTTVNGADYNRYIANKFTLASQSISRANSSVASSPYTGNHSIFKDNTCTPDGNGYTGTAYTQATSGGTGANGGCNPVGPLPAPAIPATTVAVQNLFGVEAIVSVTGGTVTAIAVGNTAGATTNTGLTSGPIRLKPNQWIALTYSVAPTWTWYGD
jgi:parallel beta-helix repeat protein